MTSCLNLYSTAKFVLGIAKTVVLWFQTKLGTSLAMLVILIIKKFEHLNYDAHFPHHTDTFR